jgi:dTMP kinase
VSGYRHQQGGRAILDRGLLITLEGIDGSGKTTQVALLAAHLAACGVPVTALREPTQGVFGRRIRELAAGNRGRPAPEEELRLFVNDRLQDVLLNIRPALRERRVVLLDRYYLSTICYQGALGLDPARLRRLNESFAPVPDLVVILDLPVDAALRRILESRRDRLNMFERTVYLEEVRRRFLAHRGPGVEVVDASRPASEVAERVRAPVRALIDRHLAEPA